MRSDRNPDFHRERRVIHADGPGPMWIGAAICAFIVVAAVAWGFGTDQKTAQRPAVTVGETTGSGAPR